MNARSAAPARPARIRPAIDGRGTDPTVRAQAPALPVTVRGGREIP